VSVRCGLWYRIEPIGFKWDPPSTICYSLNTLFLSLNSVSKTYGIYAALIDVSFSIETGEVFGYIGPNGAGKTTSLKIVAGLLSRYQGQVIIDGIDARESRERVHQQIGFLPQSVGFQSWRTVESALRTLGTLSGVASDILDKRIGYWLERFELADARTKKVKELSGGMAQKVGLIQALLHEPKLLILDEPLAGLDPVGRNLVKDVVRERREAGTAVMFSSHILSDLQDIADSVGILAEGRLLVSGSLHQLKTAFGMPVDIAVEFSQAPTSTTFLTTNPDIEDATERRHGDWLLRLSSTASMDEVVDSLIESTRVASGRIRRIGAVEPNLDEVYAKFISRRGRESLRVGSIDSTSVS